MDKIIAKGQAVLCGLAAILFGTISLVSAIRGDGASALVSFAFAYIMFDVTRGLFKEE